MNIKHYTNRKKGGKEQIYNTPDKLLSKAFEYFAWCEDNPWMKKELMRSGDRKGEIAEVPVSRPYTVAGMCVYCGISQSTFAQYSKDEAMKGAAEHITDIIRQNQLEGAIIGAYNSSFISHILAEGKEITSDNGYSPYVIEVVDQKTKENLETMINNLRQG
ncbi:hypothetical protein JGH11_10330 [Dysgonomonas sp. Marseille-P4677]|uniref:terminase small subunit n=1 Tax=Dysgonomonas sp. Marseille-P4677 TaxID=2364790 RepID=UPI001913843B|nr:terminase small subunit [Dysgonomonas sp. Marseille-P4677]MBK5721267.1 hypothetical protein [Dysgonomonas sp. Marseille-P4677]